MKALIFFVLILCTCAGFAQSIMVKEPHGSVVISKDPRLDILSAKQAEINKKAVLIARSSNYPGYRLQVINTNNRDEANTVKAEMLRRFPDQKVYLLYQAPNFRVRIGNFITQREGATLQKMIAKLYPQRGIYFVADRIEIPLPEDDEELTAD
jgi:hypothetical protein